MRSAAQAAADAQLPLKPLREGVKLSAKHKQILCSIRAVGLVEPPVVTPDGEHPGTWFIIDGHLRIEALKDLEIEAVDCLVSTDDEAFTYNKRVNRLCAACRRRGWPRRSGSTSAPSSGARA